MSEQVAFDMMYITRLWFQYTTSFVHQLTLVCTAHSKRLENIARSVPVPMRSILQVASNVMCIQNSQASHLVLIA